MSNSNSNSNVPQELRNLGVTNMNITSLDISRRNLTNLPSSIGNLKKLMNLDLRHNYLTKLPPQIGKLTKLLTLDLGYNKLESLPSIIGKLTKLLNLDLRGNKITKLPSFIGKLTNLQILDLSENRITELPSSIGNLENLLYLYLRYNPNLRIIPRSLIRSGLKINANTSTKFEHIPIVRRNVPINKVPLNINNKRSDSVTMENFKVGHNAIYLGYNKYYLHEKTLLNWIKTQNNNTNITNIDFLYRLKPNDIIGVNPLTQKPLFRKNLNFVKFVKPNTPNTLAKKLNNTKINNKPNTPNTPNTIRKKAGNAAQSRRTNRN